jgi:hypothetical protein
MFPFATVPNANFLWWLDLIATILSFCGSSWMIFCCLKAPSPKSLSLKLIAATGCADLLYSIANFLSNFETDNDYMDPDAFDLCSFEAILRQLSYVLSIYFSTCVAVAAYYSIRNPRRFNKILFLFASFITGLVICSIYLVLL